MDCELDGCGIDLLIVDVDGTFSTFGMDELLLVEVDMTTVNGDVLSKKEYCAIVNEHKVVLFRCINNGFSLVPGVSYLRLVYMANKM